MHEQSREGGIGHVLLFWTGYLAITLLAGFATNTIASEAWRVMTWGLVSSGGLLALTLLLLRKEGLRAENLGLVIRPSSFKRLSIGLLIGLASFRIHLLIIKTFVGSVRVEFLSGAIALPAVLYFAQFLSTSCMEELGFRGYALQRLSARFGMWPGLWITAIAFGLSHLAYGWALGTIALGVIPGGLLWGMSAIATRGLAVPIGLHAAWNFASWAIGDKEAPGLFRIVVEDQDQERVQAVGTASYLAVFGLLTVAFWLFHRRRARQPESQTQRSR